jgi:hypothetical protein
LLYLIAGLRRLLRLGTLLDHLEYSLGIRCENGTRDDGVVRLDGLPEVVSVPPDRRELGVVVVGLPDVDVAVLRPADYVLAVVTEAGLDLAAHVDVSFVLAGHVQIPQVVQSDPAVVRRDQDLVLPRHGLDPAYLPPGGVPAPRRSHVDLGVVLELVGVVEDAAAVVGPNHGELAVLAEVRRRYQLGVAFDLVPHRYFLVGDVPEAQLAVQRAAQEIPVISGVEDDGGDEIDMLEATETLLPRDVPQSDCLVHRRRQNEVILGPRDVQQVGGVTGVRAERLRHEGHLGAVFRIQRLQHRQTAVFAGMVRHQRLLRRRRRHLLGVVLGPHVLEEREGVPDDPDPQHLVLAGRGEQAAATRELHAPDGALVLVLELLHVLHLFELVRTFVRVGRLKNELFAPLCTLQGLTLSLMLWSPGLTESAMSMASSLWRACDTSCAMLFALCIVFFMAVPTNFFSMAVFFLIRPISSLSSTIGISTFLVPSLSSSDSFSFSMLELLTYSDVRRMMCSDRGLMHWGSLSSATLNGTRSPVSRLSTVTCCRISKSESCLPESVWVRTRRFTSLSMFSSPAERLRSLVVRLRDW